MPSPVKTIGSACSVYGTMVFSSRRFVVVVILANARDEIALPMPCRSVIFAGVLNFFKKGQR
jgi:hypothetical protein